MNTTTWKNRAISMVLTVIMVFSMLPLSVFASDGAVANGAVRIASTDNVAEVTIDGTTTGYTDIDAAFAAAQEADSATVTLMKNVTISHTDDTYGIQLEKGDITLELNGMTISQRSGIARNKFYPASAVFYLSVPGGGTTTEEVMAFLKANVRLTVQDSVGGGKIVQPNGGPAIVATLNSTLTVNSGVIENTSSDDFDDGRFHSTPNCAVLLSGGGKAIIKKDGTLSGMRGVAVAGYITKEEEQLYKDYLGIEGYNNDTYGNELTVAGGEIKGTSGHALVVYEKAKKIELSGGTFSSDNTHSIWVADTEPDGEDPIKGDAASLLKDGYRYENNGVECDYSENGNGIVGNATVALRPANEYTYIDWAGKLTARANCTEITAETWDISQGWYVVKENITISQLNISQEVNLILCDGATLTVSSYFNVGQDSTLNLYWQSAGTGKLTAKAIGMMGTVTAPAGGMKQTTGASGTTFEKCFEHDWEYKNNGDTHTATCKLCGAKETAAHNYDTLQSTDAENHTFACACGATSTENHTLTLAPNDDGLTHSSKCSVCGYATAAEDHDFSSTDEFGNKKCACGVRLAAEYDGKSYATLESAVAAAKDGGTVKLAATVTENITIADETVIIDLNGEEWYNDGRNGAVPVLIVTGGDVTVQNGTLIAGSTSKAATAVVVEGGKLTVGKDMTVQGGSMDKDKQFPAIEVKGGELSLCVGAELGFGMKVSAEGKLLKDYLSEGTAFTVNGTAINGYVTEYSSRETLVVAEHTSHSYDEDGKCDCGFECTHSGTIGEDGKCTVCGAQMAAMDSNGKYYADLSDALDGVTDGGTVTMLATPPESSCAIDFCWGTEDDLIDKTVTLDMNGHSLCWSNESYVRPVITIESGKLIIADAAISLYYNPNTPAVSVEGTDESKGSLEFRGKASIIGGLDFFGYGTIENGLKEGSILKKSSNSYSVSVEDSNTYTTVCELLPAGYAFAQYNSDGTTGDLVNGYVAKLTEDVIVVKHEHSFDKSGKCDCGYVCHHEGGNSREASYFQKKVCATCGAEYGELEKDENAPTGTIAVQVRTPFQTFINTISFGLFFKADVTATITATDDSYNHAGYDESKHAVKVEYLISETAIDEAELKNQTYTPYDKAIDLTNERSYVVYAKLTDHAGNEAYISSEGFVIDKTAPAIGGYSGTQTVDVCGESYTVTVEDDNLYTVLVDGQPKDSTDTIQFSYDPAGENKHIVKAADRAGNESEITFILHQQHDFDSATGKCENCGESAAAKVQIGDGDVELYETFNDAWGSWGVSVTEPITLTLLEDVIPDSVGMGIRMELTLDLNGHSFGQADFPFDLWSGAKFTLTGAGRFEPTVWIHGGSSLTVEPGVTYVGAVKIRYDEEEPTGWSAALKGGKYGELDLTYTDMNGDTQYAGYCGDLLAPGYVFEDGTIYYQSDATNAEVIPCSDHVWSSGVCAFCKLRCPHEHITSGECDTCGMTIVAQDNAGNNYSDLSAAFDGVKDGGKVTLLADVNRDSIFEADKSVTLDMAGHALKLNDSYTALKVKSGHLTVMDSSADQTIRIGSTSTSIEVSGGTLKFENKVYLTGQFYLTANVVWDQNGDPQFLSIGKLEGSLQEGSIFIHGIYLNGHNYETGEGPETAQELLADGYAYAKYQADGTPGDILRGDTSYGLGDYNLIIVKHTQHGPFTYGKDSNGNKGYFCACGYEHTEHVYENGHCTLCDYVCSHAHAAESAGKWLCDECGEQIVARTESKNFVKSFDATGVENTLQTILNSGERFLDITLLADGLNAGVTVTEPITLHLNGKTLRTAAEPSFTVNMTDDNYTLSILGETASTLSYVVEKGRLGLDQEGGKISYVRLNSANNDNLSIGGYAPKIDRLVFGSAAVRLLLQRGEFGEIALADGVTGSVRVSSLRESNGGRAFQYTDNSSYVPRTTEITGTNSLKNVKLVVCPHEQLGEQNCCLYCDANYIVAIYSNGDMIGPDAAENMASHADEYLLPILVRNGGSVKLLIDYASSNGEFSYDGTVGKGTLDLFGHKATGGTLTLPTGAELTVTDTSTDKTGEFMNVKASSGATLTVNGAKLGIVTLTEGSTLATTDGIFATVIAEGDKKLVDFLPEGYAFADSGTGVVVNGYVNELHNVKVVEHTTHDFRNDAHTCGCGVPCTHASGYEHGVCPTCGYTCPHDHVAVDGDTYTCPDCQAQMVVKVEYEDENGTDQTKYYAQSFEIFRGEVTDTDNTLKVVFNAAPTGSTVTLLADRLQAWAHVKGGRTITLNLNGKKLIETANGICTYNDNSNNKLIVTGTGTSEKNEDLTVNRAFAVYGGTLEFDSGFGGEFNEVYVSGGTLTFAEGQSATIHTLTIAGDVTITPLKGGKFGKIVTEGSVTRTASSLLARGYAFQKADGSYVPYHTEITATSALEDVTVVWCDHGMTEMPTGYQYNKLKCPDCGKPLNAVLTTADGKINGYEELTSAYGKTTALSVAGNTPGCTVTMYNDAYSVGIWNSNADFTLDANGCTIGYLMLGSGTLTVKNATITGDEHIGDSTVISSGTKLTLEDCTVEKKKESIEPTLAVNGPVTLKDCTVNGTTRVNGYDGLTVENSNLVGDIDANGKLIFISGTAGKITLYSDAEDEIRGGSIGELDATQMENLVQYGGKSGSLTISGGTFGKITAPNDGRMLIDCLKDGYAFYNDGGDNSVVDGRTGTLEGVKVREHTHGDYKWDPATHEKVCACGYVTETDTTAPTIGGIADGETYYQNTLTFTAEDTGSGLASVKDGGKALIRNASGEYTITADNKAHTITATDNAGNTATVTVTVYKVYKITLPSGTGYTVTGPDTVNHGEEYVFTVRLDDGYSRVPDRYKVTAGGFELTAMSGDNDHDQYWLPSVTGDLTVTVEGIADITAPDTEMTIGENKFNKLLNSLTFGLFFKETQTVTVTAADLGSGVDDTTAAYLLIDGLFGKDTMPVEGWTSFDMKNGKGSFSIEPNAIGSVYVRIADKDGNVALINSDGVVVYTDSTADTESISFTRLSDKDVSFKVNLNGNTVKSLTCGDEEIDSKLYTVDEDGTITLKNEELRKLAVGEYTITVAYAPMGVDYTPADNSGSAAPAATTVKLTVLRATRTLEFEASDAVYDGKAYDDLTITDKPDGTTVEYLVDGSYTTDTPKNVGSYTVRITTPQDESYNAAVFTATFTISPKKVTITGVTADSKTYDGNTEAAIIADDASLSVNYDGENLTIDTSDAKAVFDSKNVGTDKTVTFSGFALGGAAASNYELAAQPEPAMANIVPKNLTVENLKVKDKVYDGTTAAELDGTPTLKGVEDGDEVQLDCGRPTFASTDVGENIAINFTLFFLSGTDSGNYTLTQPTGITGNIAAWLADGSEYRVNSNDWINTDFIVWANSGYRLSLSNTASGNWSTHLSVSDETDKGELVFYVQNTATGAISNAVTEHYKIDKTAPVGTISLEELDFFKELLETISFDTFLNEDLIVEISAGDGESGVKSVSYYKSSKALDEIQLDYGVTWTEGSDFTVTAVDGAKLVVYARIEDNAGNVTYLSTDGMVFDTIAPEIIGVENGETYYVTRRVAADDENLASVTVNGEPVTMDAPFDLAGDKNAVYTVVATDKAGNVTEYTVTMKPISSITDAIKDITEENVKSSDADAIKAVAQQILDIAAESEEDVIGEEQWNKLLTAAESCKALERRIAEVAAEITRLTDAVSGYDIDKVTSADKTDIERLIANLNVLLATDNLTDAERAVLEARRETVQTLLDRIAAAKSAAESDEIIAVKDITKDNVTLDDRDALEKAEAALENALRDFGGNYTDEERKELEDDLERIRAALAAIGHAEEALQEVEKLPAVDAVKLTDKEEVERVKELIDALTENEKAMLGEDAITKVKALLERIEALTAEAEKPETPATGDARELAMWIALLFVSGGVVTGVSVAGKKKKQQD